MEGPTAVGALSHCTQSTVNPVVKTLVSYIFTSFPYTKNKVPLMYSFVYLIFFNHII